LAVTSILLPPLVARYPYSAPLVRGWIGCQLYTLRTIYRIPAGGAGASSRSRSLDIRSRAADDFLHGGVYQLPAFQPPSDLKSAFRGFIAFSLSALADIVSMILDSKKMTKWFQAIAEFKAYLDVSGLGGDLDEAVYRPMMRGRLLDNLKILHDVQLKLYADRCERLNVISSDKIKCAILEGKRYDTDESLVILWISHPPLRMMRFATAGTYYFPLDCSSNDVRCRLPYRSIRNGNDSECSRSGSGP
jgi:hypothetical protein